MEFKSEKAKKIGRYILLIIPVIFILFFRPPMSSADSGAWYNTSWQYRKVITIDHNKIASSTAETYANFPLLISLPSDPDLAANASSTGADIVFTSNNGVTKLSHEIESYSSSTGALLAWVNVGAAGISTSTDTTLYMYYGNTSVPSQQNITGTWSNYVGVYHLSTTTDSTDLTFGTPTGISVVSGEIGSGFLMANATKVDFGAGSKFSSLPAAGFSAETWVSDQNINTFNTTGVILDKFNNGSAGGWRLSLKQGSTQKFIQFVVKAGSSATWNTANGSFGDTSLHHIAVTYQYVNNSSVPAIYLDGSPLSVTVATAPTAIPQTDTATKFVMNDQLGSVGYLSGVLDETRIIKKVLTNDWIKTEYANQSSPSTFYSVGSQTDISGVPPGIGLFSAAPAFTGLNGSATLSWLTTGASTVSIDQGVGLVSGTGSTTVSSITNTTTYTLTAANGVGTTTATATVTVDNTPPTTPSNITASSTNSTSLNLAWTASADAGGSGVAAYNIFRCIGTCTPSTRIATTSATSYADTGLTASTTYTYALTAYDNLGNVSATSTAASGTTLTIPDAPTGLSAAAGNSQATISFTPPVFTGGSPVIYYTAVANPGGNTASSTASPIVVTGLINAQNYTFTVTATNNSGTSIPSSASNSVTPIVLDTMVYTDESGAARANEPVQFGRIFKEGEIATYPQVLLNGVPVTTQANIENRWDDGSVKMAIISFLLPSLSANGSVTISFQGQPECNCGSATHLSKSDMLDSRYNFDADITAASSTVSARQELVNWDGATTSDTGPVQYWADGAVSTTVILADNSAAAAYDIMVNGHPSLRPVFMVTFWPTINKVRVRYVLENTNTTELQDISYNALLTAGSSTPTTVYNSTVTWPSGIPQLAATRWTKIAWIGTAPDDRYNLDNNVAYMALADAVPNYDISKTVSNSQIATDYSLWNGGTKDIYQNHGANGYTWDSVMGDTGGRDDIGPFPTWYTRWLYTGDYREREIMLGDADLAGSWQVNFREGAAGKFYDIAGTIPAIGLPLSIAARPTLDFGWGWPQNDTNSTDKLNPVGTVAALQGGLWKWDASHIPDTSFLPYIVTGDYYYLEQQRFFASYSAAYTTASTNINYGRGPSLKSGMTYGGQLRAEAWGLRERSEATWMEPDNTAEQGLFRQWMASDIGILDGVHNLTQSQYYGNADWNWGRSVRATNPTETFDGVNQPVIPGHGGEQWWFGQIAFCEGGYGVDTSVCNSAYSQFELDYLSYALGRAYELGFPTQHLMGEVVGPWYVAELTDPTYNPYLIQMGRIPTQKKSGPGYFTSMADLLTGYWPSQAAAMAAGTNLWSTVTTLPLSSANSGYDILGSMATAEIEPYTTGGSAAWSWAQSHIESSSVYSLQSDPTWAILPRTIQSDSSNIPVIASFTASSPTIIDGGSSTLSWSISGADSVSINQSLGSEATSTGSVIVSPTTTTTYVISANNSNGTSTAQTTVTVTVLSAAKAITAFNFTSPPATGSINETNHTIAITVPFGTNVTSLVPAITTTGASVSPSSGVAQDFTSPATYTVTAADSSTQNYTVTVSVAPNTAKAIASFDLDGLSPNVTGTVNESAKTVTLTVPFGTSLTALVPTITITGASVSPGSGVAHTFVDSVASNYTVTAADNSTQVYAVTVHVAQNTAKSITVFNFNGLSPAVTGVVDETYHIISLTVPFGTNVTALVPTIAAPGAAVSPNSGVAQDFTNQVMYTVTAADSSTQQYFVIVTVSPSSAKAITSFNFNGLSPAVIGSINETTHTISVNVPFGTEVSDLVPTIGTTGESVSPSSGVAQNFSLPVVYTAIAGDDSIQSYTVTVTVAPAGTHSLTLSSLYGSIAKSPDQTNYASGTVVSLTVTPNSGYTFSSWSGDASGSTNPLIVTMDSDKNIIANYALSGGGGGGGGGGGYSGGGGGGYVAPPSQPTTPASPVNPPSPGLAAPNSGSPMVSLINNNGTYYLIEDGTLHGITNPGILKSFGFSLTDAKPASSDDLALPQGNLLSPEDGSLVRTAQNPTVYLVSGQQRHGFVSADVFTALGFKFSSIVIVTDPELNKLPLGTIISTSAGRHLRGVQIKSQGTVYFMGDSVRYPYPSLEVYNSWNIDNDFSAVVPANTADLIVPVGPPDIARVIN